MDSLWEKNGVLRSGDPGGRGRRADGQQRNAVAEFAPRSRAARAYEELWREVRDKLD